MNRHGSASAIVRIILVVFAIGAVIGICAQIAYPDTWLTRPASGALIWTCAAIAVLYYIGWGVFIAHQAARATPLSVPLHYLQRPARPPRTKAPTAVADVAQIMTGGHADELADKRRTREMSSSPATVAAVADFGQELSNSELAHLLAEQEAHRDR